MGEKNNVFKPEEKLNGLPVTDYEVRDPTLCCSSSGLSDLHSVGSFFTWTNNTVMSKLDRALVNDLWWMANFRAYAEFLPPGCLSDHSPCIVSVLHSEDSPRRPF